MTDRTRHAWAYLSRVAEPPCPDLSALVDEVGAVDAADRVRRGYVNATVARHTAARRDLDCAGEDLEQLDSLGGRLVTADDDEWPAWAFTAFAGAGDRPECLPPLALWVVGPACLDELTERCAALVGTRAATAYGEQVTADLAAGLAEADVTVISGGAYGIDGAAHRAVLAGGGTTAAVLAGGLNVPYPAGHSALLHRIARTGALISEYPPGSRPFRHRFLYRNRLVAACSGATVVVEAGLRSGAANTAAWARSLGRVVGAVPGPVTSAASAGAHVLLRGGAELITRPAEIVELVGRMGELAPEMAHPTTVLDELEPVQRRVYEALPGRGAASVEQIAVGAALPVDQVLGPLALLEVAGLAERRDGRWAIVRPRRPSV